jgi:XTP/dITP diphosphohydrolase
MDRRCVLASGNQGKLREFAQLLSPLNLQIVDQTSLGIDSCPEPHATFVENALEKARHAARLSGLPALADDSGICLPSLNGAPGVLSARFAQSIGFELPKELSNHASNKKLNLDQTNNLALMSEISKKIALARFHASTQSPTLQFDESPIRKAYYACALVYLRSATDPQPLIAQANWWGLLQDEARGDNGFGYDGHFYLPDMQWTVAQLSAERKNQISHRAKAMQALLVQMKDLL